MAKQTIKSQLDDLAQIKKSAIVAMFSDDYLLEKLVLKGGNAIDIAYGIPSRSSIDLDFSIAEDFDQTIPVIKGKIEKVLREKFREEGYIAFDIKFQQKPIKRAKKEDFWGGYTIEFKLAEMEVFREKHKDVDDLRRNSKVLGPRQERKFRIDISKYEYCGKKVEKEIDGYTIYVYTPEMIILEKIRSICQQMPEYRKIIKTKTSSARARDFFDIYILMTHFRMDIGKRENGEILKDIFQAKKVPLGLIKEIHKYREYHRPDFESLRATVDASIDLRDFDFYFDFVLKETGKIAA